MIDKERINKFQIFDELADDELDGILRFATEVEFKAGATILETACVKADSDLFVVLQGMVKVELEAPQSKMAGGPKSKRLAVLKDGAVFGEIGLLRGKGRSARVVAYLDVSVLRIDQWKLYGLLESNQHMGYILMRNLAIILSNRLVDVNFMWRDDI